MQHKYTTKLSIWMALAGTAGVAFGQTYSIVDLSPGPVISIPFGITSAGQVVGTATNDIYEGSRFRATSWDDSTPTFFAPLVGDQDSIAFSASGSRIAAVSFSTGSLGTHALIIDNGSVASIGDFSPRAINGSGQVAGWTGVTLGTGWLARQACVYSNGTLSMLPGIGGDNSMALANNAAGDVVGTADVTGSMHTHATLWSNGAAYDLGTLGGLNSQACGVNDSRQVTGYSQTAAGYPHAYIFNVAPNGSVSSRVDLGSLGQNMSYGSAINNQGKVVGTSNNRAFLWDGTQMLDLNDMVNPASGWELRTATSISDSGEIVGTGLHNGWPAAFKLVQACVADFNGDGSLDFFDVQMFLGLFAAHDPAADLIPDGAFDFFDVQRFLTMFSAGCP